VDLGGGSSSLSSEAGVSLTGAEGVDDDEVLMGAFTVLQRVVKQSSVVSNKALSLFRALALLLPLEEMPRPMVVAVSGGDSEGGRGIV